MKKLQLKSYLSKWRVWLWWQVMKALPVNPYRYVGNRAIRKGNLGAFEVTIILRDTRQPDEYSREELYEMLKLIRENEAIQEWKVPEPPRWIVVSDHDGAMHHVTWSEQDAEGFWLSIRHYPTKHFAEIDADRFNRIGRMPWEYPDWKNAPRKIRGDL